MTTHKPSTDHSNADKWYEHCKRTIREVEFFLCAPIECHLSVLALLIKLSRESSEKKIMHQEIPTRESNLKKMKTKTSISIIMLGLCLTVPTKTFSQSNKNTTMETLASSKIETQQFFIDKFIVPQSSRREFFERMNVNRNFIKTQPGFVEDNVYERMDEHDNLIIVTVARWENEDAIKHAKSAVQALYQKEGFDMQAFLKRLNIVIDRGVYKKSKD